MNKWKNLPVSFVVCILFTCACKPKNKALEEYAFINAHKLRSPVASLLGLINLMSKTILHADAEPIMKHMHEAVSPLSQWSMANPKHAMLCVLRRTDI